jgi:methionyl-tRNA formyltransferase
MVEALDRLAGPGLAATPQPAEGVTYAAKIDKAEARIDWNRPAVEVARQINGLSPFPGAWFEVCGHRVKVLLAEVAAGVAGGVPGGSAPPGTVLDDAATVACGGGAVRLVRLQRAGKGPMEATAFLRGQPLAIGESLGAADTAAGAARGDSRSGS